MVKTTNLLLKWIRVVLETGKPVYIAYTVQYKGLYCTTSNLLDTRKIIIMAVVRNNWSTQKHLWCKCPRNYNSVWWTRRGAPSPRVPVQLVIYSVKSSDKLTKSATIQEANVTATVNGMQRYLKLPVREGEENDPAAIKGKNQLMSFAVATPRYSHRDLYSKYKNLMYSNYRTWTELTWYICDHDCTVSFTLWSRLVRIIRVWPIQEILNVRYN